MTKKDKISQTIILILSFIIGVSSAFFIVDLQPYFFSLINNNSLSNLLSIIIFLVFGYISIFLSVIIHELGHLVFGLISGYGFSSFRILSLCFIKKDGKIKVKRLILAGTAGQCLMTPPKNTEIIPYKLFNLGGCLYNLAFFLIGISLAFILQNHALAFSFFGIFGIVNLIICFNNGIPMRNALIQNDAKNIIDIGKNPKALEAFVIQLQVAEQQTKGLSLTEMPSEWFTFPNDSDLNNPLIATQAYFACVRELELHNFYSAHVLIRRLLSNSTGLLGVYQGLLNLELIYLDAINNWDEYPNILTRLNGLNKFTKSLANTLCVQRVLYTVELLCNNDVKKANEKLKAFEKIAKKYPYPQEVENERKFIELAKIKADIKNQ